jgi:hypothetical protein
MSPLYILLFPLFTYLIYNKLTVLQLSIKSSNPSKFKADLFFLLLLLLVGVLIVFAIEYV